MLSSVSAALALALVAAVCKSFRAWARASSLAILLLTLLRAVSPLPLAALILSRSVAAEISALAALKASLIALLKSSY